MTNKLLGLAITLALPTMVAAQTPQIPNEHASTGERPWSRCTRKVRRTVRSIAAETW